MSGKAPGGAISKSVLPVNNFSGMTEIGGAVRYDDVKCSTASYLRVQKLMSRFTASRGGNPSDTLNSYSEETAGSLNSFESAVSSMNKGHTKGTLNKKCISRTRQTKQNIDNHTGPAVTVN